MPEATQPKPKAQPAGAGFREPYGAFNFKVSIPGVGEAGFTRCSALGAERKAVEYRQGGDHEVVHRLPGRIKYPDVTLYWGLTASKEMWLWMDSSIKGTPRKVHVTIAFLAQDGTTEAVRFNLNNAWPTSWSGAPLDALGNEIAIEQLTLVYEKIERVL